VLKYPVHKMVKISYLLSMVLSAHKSYNVDYDLCGWENKYDLRRNQFLNWKIMPFESSASFRQDTGKT